MKYTCEILIDRPLAQVAELFDNPDNLMKWMEGLQQFEPISGTPGTVGAKSRLIFQNGSRRMEMTETITRREMPYLMEGTYEIQGVQNLVRARFEKVDENRTRYISDQEFRFTGLLKLLAFFMPGMFRKQTEKHLAAFKRFAESQN